jgi:hypothetical protein
VTSLQGLKRAAWNVVAADSVHRRAAADQTDGIADRRAAQAGALKSECLGGFPVDLSSL